MVVVVRLDHNARGGKEGGTGHEKGADEVKGKVAEKCWSQRIRYRKNFFDD